MTHVGAASHAQRGTWRNVGVIETVTASVDRAFTVIPRQLARMRLVCVNVSRKCFQLYFFQYFKFTLFYKKVSHASSARLS